MYAKALNDKGEIIIVKIQNIRKLYYLEQVLYGVAKTITEYISLGEDYLYHGQNHFIGVHTKDQLVVNTKERNAIVSRLPSEIFPEYILIRVNEFDKVAVTPLEEWMNYLKDRTIRPGTMAPGLGEAREKLKYYSMTPEDRHAYDEHLNAVMIQNDVLDSAKLEGRMEGLAEGEAKGKAEFVFGCSDVRVAYSSIEPLTIPRLEDLMKLRIKSRSSLGSYSVSIAFSASVLFKPRVYSVR